MNISFDTLQKRVCVYTNKDKQLLQKYTKMEELPEKFWDKFEYTYPQCKVCYMEINPKWTYCPNCGMDLPETKHNEDKTNGCKDAT